MPMCQYWRVSYSPAPGAPTHQDPGPLAAGARVLRWQGSAWPGGPGGVMVLYPAFSTGMVQVLSRTAGSPWRIQSQQAWASEHLPGVTAVQMYVSPYHVG